MKRFIATTAIVTLMLTSFAGCSKKEKENENNPNGTPTVSANQNDSEQGSDITSDIIPLGGSFTNDNASLNIYLSEGSWRVSGILFPQKDEDSALILNGPLTHDQGVNFIYSTDNDKITFTFAKDSMTITVDKGTNYSGFAGKYRRIDTTTEPESGSVTLTNGSTLAFLGRIAAAHYMTRSEGVETSTLNLSTTSFTNDDMLKFVVTYADLFLAGESQPVPEISTEYLFYAFSEDDLNNLLLAATAGTFDISKLSVADSDITLKDGTFYVPCRGNYAGGLATSQTTVDPDEVNEQIELEATIVKKDGTLYNIEMTLSTSENAKAGAAGIQIDSVAYKTVK